MSFVSISALAEATPDPTKHVNYTVGMVLGVDDFTQEFTYLTGRDRWLAATGIGSGILSGLEVTVSPGNSGPGGVVQVGSGTAVSPSGWQITVPTAQCADIDQWLAAHAEQLGQPGGGSPPADLTLYILLSYADQPTDPVPIPADPNVTGDGLTAPSRLQDSFLLQLSATPPAGDTSSADAAFVTWLGDLHYTASSGSTIADLLDALRTAAAPGSPPEWPPPAWSPPPASLVIPRSQAVAYLRAAVSLWVTDLRPALVATAGGGSTATDTPPTVSDAVLVASLTVPLGADLTSSGPANVSQSGQSVVPAQLLQELALNSAVPQPTAAQGIGLAVGAGRFVLVREGDGEEAEIELRTLFSQNLEATIVPRPGTPAAQAEHEEARAHEHYVRLRLESGHREHHRYVLSALPLVEGHGARYAIEEVSDPSHHGVGSHSGPFMMRLAPVDIRAPSARVGLSVQITDLGPGHPRRSS